MTIVNKLKLSGFRR